MKKKVIAFLLSVVLASGSIVPALAAETASETTAEEAVIEEETAEETTEESEEITEETADAETEEVAEGASEEESVEEIEEEPAQELTEEDEDVETETTEETVMAENSEEADSVDTADTSAEMAEAEEPAVIAEVGSTEVKAEEAALAESDIVDSGTCGDNAIWTLTGTEPELVLTISGSGSMNLSKSTIPWASKRAKIRTVIIEEGITNIGDYAFLSLINLTSITIPDSVTSIEFCAFDGCSSLESVTIPDSVTSIDDIAFRDCRSLTSIEIPDSVTMIGNFAFSGCSSLTRVTISDSMTYITYEAFSYCSSLESVTIPDSVTSIERSAFYGCSSLTSITIPDSVTNIEDKAFGSDNAINIRFRGTEDQWKNAIGNNGVYYKSIVYNYFSVDADFKLSDTSFNYTGKAIRPAVTVTYDGQKLIEGTDYELVYKNNTNAGTATITINGIGNYSGTATKNFTIKKAANTITAKSIVKSYSAQVQTFDLGAKVKNGTPTYKSDNKSVTVSKAGKVTVKAKFIGNANITITSPAGTNYTSAKKTIVIKVMPTKTKFTSVTNSASKKMTLKWVKRTNATGYIIQYSTSSTFDSAKTVRIDKYTTISTTIGNLVKGKKYYVRIKTFKTVSGTKYYSGWSDVMSVKIAK